MQGILSNLRSTVIAGFALTLMMMAARLRAMKSDDNLLLLRTNMDAGHAGASGRFDSLKVLVFCSRLPASYQAWPLSLPPRI